MLALTPSACEVRGREHHISRVPAVAGHRLDVFAGSRTSRVRHVPPCQLPPIEDWYGEGELLPELRLPLPDHGCRHEQEGTLHGARDEELPDDRTDLDGLSKADLVGEHPRARPRRDDLASDVELVRPHLDGGGADPHARVQAGGCEQLVEIAQRCLGRLLATSREDAPDDSVDLLFATLLDECLAGQVGIGSGDKAVASGLGKLDDRPSGRCCLPGSSAPRSPP